MAHMAYWMMTTIGLWRQPVVSCLHCCCLRAIVCNCKCFALLQRVADILHTFLHRKHTIFYVVDFKPLCYFWLVMASKLTLSLLGAEDLSSWTWALEIVPKGCAILARSQGVDIEAAPASNDIWHVVVQSQFRLIPYGLSVIYPWSFWKVSYTPSIYWPLDTVTVLEGWLLTHPKRVIHPVL